MSDGIDDDPAFTYSRKGVRLSICVLSVGLAAGAKVVQTWRSL